MWSRRHDTGDSDPKKSWRRASKSPSTTEVRLHAPSRKDKLSAGNRSVVNTFESELTHDVKSLCNTVVASMSQQNKQLQCIEKFFHSFFNINDKGIIDLRKKIAASKALYISHIEELQNVVLLHKANFTVVTIYTSLGDDALIHSLNEVGTAYLLALESFNNLTVSPTESIEYDRLIENEYLGLKNGLLDQSAILLSSNGVSSVLIVAVVFSSLVK